MRENVRGLRPELWRQKSWDCCITTTHGLTLPFSPEIYFTKVTLLPTPPTLFYSISRLKIKLKGHHFDIEAESQAVLSGLTEHDSQDAFKMAAASETAHKSARGLLQGDGGQ
jgi:hypothetical protein